MAAAFGAACFLAWSNWQDDKRMREIAPVEYPIVDKAEKILNEK